MKKSLLFVIFLGFALLFRGGAQAEEIPRALENINPGEIQKITPEEAKNIRGGPCQSDKSLRDGCVATRQEIPEHSFYNGSLRQTFRLLGYNARPGGKK